jgi:hypothetical protein
MATEEGAVGEDGVAADDDIMAEVSSSHDIVVIADERARAGLQGPVDRDVFPKDVVVADSHTADLLRPRDMLRRAADHGVLRELVVAPGADASLDYSPAGNGAEVAKFHVVFDGGECPDLHADPKSCIRAHDGHRVDAHGAPFNAAWRGKPWVYRLDGHVDSMPVSPRADTLPGSPCHWEPVHPPSLPRLRRSPILAGSADESVGRVPVFPR